MKRTILFIIALCITACQNTTPATKIDKLHISINGDTVVTDTYEYVGEHDAKGVANGEGVMKYSWGDVVSGIFENGHLLDGIYTYSNGDIFTGTMSDRWEFVKGRMVYSDGSEYDGEWKGDKPNGKGVMKKVNGTRYIGTFANGEAVNTIVIHGNCVEGDCYDGYGVLYKDGNVYKGDFSGGNYEGEGSIIYADGSKYIGEWNNGTYCGKGKLIDQESISDGDWTKGVLRRGIVRYYDGRADHIIVSSGL